MKQDLLVPNPSNACSDAGANASYTKEDSKVLGARRDVTELDDIADNSDDHESNDEDATLEDLIRVPASC